MFRSVCAYILTILFFAPLACASEVGAREKTKKYSMTISGGVSLGIYEAGVNWAIVEALRVSGNYELQSVTGASAGAINTVLTGLRYCEADVDDSRRTAINSSFYRTWNVQLADFLPDRDKYGTLELQGVGVSSILEDSIFSRNIYIDRLLEVSKLVRLGKYRNGCEVDIAIVVTRSEPEFRAFGSGEVKTRVPNQRYVVPLTLVVEGNNEVVTGISFKNNLHYSALSQRSSKYLYLPEEDGGVPFDTVARAVMASSAFPLVFGRVEMSYCLPITEPVGGQSAAPCPADHFLDTNHFIDGGVFDNVPVGVAVELVNARGKTAEKDGSHSYIFLDAEGGTADHYSGKNGQSRSDYSVGAQLDALTPLFATLRKQVLAESLSEYFGSVDAPQLLLTQRTIPIVGTYLRKFGALFDRSFFYHDYAAGVFDGIRNVADFLCSGSSSFDSGSDCKDGPESLQKELFNVLVTRPLADIDNGVYGCELDTCDSEIFVKLMQAFDSRDSSSDRNDEMGCSHVHDVFRDDNRGYVNQTLSVFVALCNGRFDGFDDLIFALDRQRTADSGVFKKRRWVYGEEVEFVLGRRISPWTFGFVERSLQRLLDLENKYQGQSGNAFAAAWAMMPGSEHGNRAVLRRNRWLAHLSPDYIGIDGFQSGVAVAWDWALPLPELNCQRLSKSTFLRNYCENYRIMFGVGGHFRRVVNERDRFNTTSAFIGVDFSRPESFLRSSSGVRFVYNADYLPVIDNDTNFDTYNSVEVYSRFFGNKIEVSLGFEGNSLSFGQDDLRLRLGVYDVDRFLALMCPSCF